jgi:UDP-N-acetylmuramoylalanine--D-glutamate ligase
MKVAILGYGSQGRAALRYWSGLGHKVTICDANKAIELPAGVDSKLGSDYLTGLHEFDLMVRTPGLHPRDIVDANPDHPEILSRVTTVTNEFMRICPAKIMGVTGTKGKGTTSTLIARMLEAADKTVHLGGNIGIPPLDMLENGIQPDDWVVLELANFQLIDLQHSPAIGVCLMVVPEHLNWHIDMEDYITAKQGLFRHQSPDNLSVYNANNAHSKQVASVSPARKLAYDVPLSVGVAPQTRQAAYVLNETIYMQQTAICPVENVALLGRHNLENICAAISAVWEISGRNIAAIAHVIASFTGLEHRLEFVREIEDVRYYDDSFGTTPETAIVAMKAFNEPKVVILGGSDKGASYDELAQAVVQNNVRAVVTIGETGPAIAEALKTAGYDKVHPGGETMAKIVTAAHVLTQPGDVVLLSTGCASFGLFKNYKDRAEQFKKTVLTLA